MIKVTDNAIAQFKLSILEQGDDPLRIEVKQLSDNSFNYLLGFDTLKQGDEFIEVKGVKFIFSDESKALIAKMTIDYVEIEAGQFEFIFLNPNDPAFVKPTEL